MEGARNRQFMIHDCLGRGGFGEVYRATMVSPGGLKTRVALKLLRMDADPGGDAMSRLRDEGRLLAALRHPSILRAYDLALLDGRIGLVTEYVEGQDLHACIGPAPDALPPRASVEVIGSVAEALHAAWTTRLDDRDQPLQLIHRDIKPSNIRLGLHGEVKLLDFGIARSDEVDREARTGTGSTVGSLSYMAPERFSREPPGPEADVYALGCTLFECLSGTRLHEDPVPVEMFRLAANADTHDRHVTDALAKLDAPGGVKALLQRMLTHDKSARPDAEEVASKCDALQEGMAGDSLKRWARARMWPDPARVSGAFDGRTITEGTLSGAQDGLEPLPEIPTQTADTFSFDVPSLRPEPVHTESLVPTERVAPPPEDRRSPVALVAVVLVLFLFGGGALAMALSGETTPPPVPPIPVAVPVPVPVPEPVVPAPVEPEPAVEPEPVEPEPAVEPEPVVPDPVPAPPIPKPPPVPVVPAHPVPEPEPVPPPVPVPPPTPVVVQGSVVVEGALPGVKIELVGPSGRFPPGLVPVGTYALYVGGQESGKITVSDSLTSYIECNGLRQTCWAR